GFCGSEAHSYRPNDGPKGISGLSRHNFDGKRNLVNVFSEKYGIRHLGCGLDFGTT
ncbi:uncharacterized protein METZ01_LOCUS219811, partial [marine metagenome]